MDLLQPQVAVDMMVVLGLPLALLTLLGIWKLLGILAIWLPGTPRLKEWAFAGFFFDLTGAAWLHGAAEDWGGVVPPLVIACVGAGAYAAWRWRTAETP